MDITATTAEAEDYTGEDGLLYCGKCHTPKEAYFAEGKTCFGRDRHPTDCDCQRAAREKQQAAESRQKHLEKVEDLKRRGFTDPAMQNWTFEHDEFTMKPILDENGRLIPREDYRISSLNCGGEDFAVSCMRANLRYEKNQKREDVKSHHYDIVNIG